LGHTNQNSDVFCVATPVHNSPNRLGKQQGGHHRRGEQQHGNRHCSAQQARGPNRYRSWNGSPEGQPIFVGELPSALKFQQALSNHFRQNDQVFWALIRIAMQHSAKQGPQRLRKS
jgi:hypothetical protein